MYICAFVFLIGRAYQQFVYVSFWIKIISWLRSQSEFVVCSTTRWLRYLVGCFCFCIFRFASNLFLTTQIGYCKRAGSINKVRRHIPTNVCIYVCTHLYIILILLLHKVLKYIYLLKCCHVLKIFETKLNS